MVAVFPADRVYARNGRPVKAPMPGEPVADEARVRRLARLNRVDFHSDALNAEFFVQLPAEERPAALAAVVEVALRTPKKSVVTISEHAITVVHHRVVLTLSPGCLVVTKVSAPDGKGRSSPVYKARDWRYRPDTGRPQTTLPAAPASPNPD